MLTLPLVGLAGLVVMAIAAACRPIDLTDGTCAAALGLDL
jgi:hypothetical protein